MNIDFHLMMSLDLTFDVFINYLFIIYLFILCRFYYLKSIVLLKVFKYNFIS